MKIFKNKKLFGELESEIMEILCREESIKRVQGAINKI